MNGYDKDWFAVDRIDDDTYIISEYRHWEETHCYLLIGKARALLIDTGLGIRNIAEVVASLTDKPVTAIATHVHWDHIGGHRYFPDFYVHESELDWINGKFPLPINVVRDMVMDRCDAPNDFDVAKYELFSGTPTKVLRGGEVIDLGGRAVEAVHTAGHCVFGSATEGICLRAIWCIKIRCSLIIRPPIRKHICSRCEKYRS